jgi:type IV secretory pathway protease TraF
MQTREAILIVATLGLVLTVGALTTFLSRISYNPAMNKPIHEFVVKRR